MTIGAFLIGMALLVLGAEALARGATRLAATLGISPLVIGLTVVAFGTSAPEMAVSVGAALIANPPHSHGALLMVDFLLNPTGQQVLEKFLLRQRRERLRIKKWRPERGLTTDEYEKELLRWEKLLKAITRK